MGKVGIVGTLAPEILMDCGNLMLAAKTFYLIQFLKLRYV
jgi:hypothetical protein